MSNPSHKQESLPAEFADMQALVRFGHGKLIESCFQLLTVKSIDAARRWLLQAPVSSAERVDPPPGTAMHIAFSAVALKDFGLDDATCQQFSEEFLAGMAGDRNRSRRLGDLGDSAPEYWEWGGASGENGYVLLMLYTTKGGMAAYAASVQTEEFHRGFDIVKTLPGDLSSPREPFGFADGISQPALDWERQQGTDVHSRDRYSNWLASGEVVLGYPNEYGAYTSRALLDIDNYPQATVLPDAEEQPAYKDLVRNGSYLVFRQLQQDVRGFWKSVDDLAGGDAARRDAIAAAWVGREQDGTPLVPMDTAPIDGIAPNDKLNQFTYENDPLGQQCPIGAHVRRANPRTGDFPPGVTGLLSRLLIMLGLKQQRRNEDLVAATRFHRLLRRGRNYGPRVTPAEALEADSQTPTADKQGLHFICLVANISRQFEFVQSAWLMNSKFAGQRDERDPLIGHREPLLNGDRTDGFSHADKRGPRMKAASLPVFTQTVGGGYFFLPGLRALHYIASVGGPSMSSGIAPSGQQSDDRDTVREHAERS